MVHRLTGEPATVDASSTSESDAFVRHSRINDLRPQPGMPLPSGLATVLALQPPIDAGCIERLRDFLLWLFSHRRVDRIFLTLSLIVMVLVTVTTALCLWSILGLFLGVDK